MLNVASICVWMRVGGSTHWWLDAISMCGPPCCVLSVASVHGWRHFMGDIWVGGCCFYGGGSMGEC